MIFYNFSSNIQTSLRNVSLECIIFMNFYRVFHLWFLTISHLCRCEGCQPNSLMGMAPPGNPSKTGLLAPNCTWMFVWSTPTIICVWSVICMNFYRVFSFTIFYDFSSNIQTSLRNVSLECIIFMNFYRVFSIYNCLRFLIQHPNWYQKHKTTFKRCL